MSFLESHGITLHNLAPQVSLNPHFPPPYCDAGVVPLSGQCEFWHCVASADEPDHLPPLPPPAEPLIIRALSLLLQANTFPTLVCCNMGRHRTGTVVGCWRKLQRWALSSILEEYRRYAGMKVRVLNEQVSCNITSFVSSVVVVNRTQFIELFDTDLVSITDGTEGIEASG